MLEDNCKLEEGERVIGLKQVTKGLINNEFKTVYIALDCDSFIENKILPIIKEGVLVVRKYTQKQLGETCNIDVNAAVVGILRKSL